jgi:predicted nucleotidyltransferase
MTEEDVVARIAEERATIVDRFGVRTLLVFGSAARGDLEDDSDVDVLVEFEGPADFDRFIRLKLHLKVVLGRPVDLVTPNALPDPLRSTVGREGRRVA